jgi:hypothetical protein
VFFGQKPANTEGCFLDLKLPSPYFHDIVKKIILRIFADKFVDMVRIESLKITFEILQLISEIDEFKGAWIALGNLSPDTLL